MSVRKRYLPPGWYPWSADQTRAAIAELTQPPVRERPPSIAGVAPHAGWEFSGRLALEVLSTLSPALDTIVIIGGHLGPADGILCAFEDAYETPLGSVPSDLELMEKVRGSLPIREDRHADNTVEIHLPFVRHLFPRVRALGFRAPPSREAEALGAALARVAEELGRAIAVVGSTDLTHYGSNYGFAPSGSGEEALKWVREVNDRRFIESVLGLDVGSTIDRALRERSACSAGGAIAAMGFARAMGATRGELIRYMTSFEVHPAESFVGYAGIVFRKDA
jgi:AmmeMemoRadiSam system protein B